MTGGFHRTARRGPVPRDAHCLPVRYRVLHVETDPGVVGVTAACLRQYGLDVEAATSTAAALELLGDDTRPRYDCVVSDYRLPRLDGLELAACVNRRYPDLPFALFTGETDLDDVEVATGVDVVVEKSGREAQFGQLARCIRSLAGGAATADRGSVCSELTQS